MKFMSKNNGGKGGIITNVASVLGLTVLPGTPIYNATKHAVIAFTRSMAVGQSKLHFIQDGFNLFSYFHRVV